MASSGSMSTAFRCDAVEQQAEVLVTAAGDLDLSVLDELRRCLAEAMKPGKPVFIDLTSVSFIDGRGFGAIRQAARSAPSPTLPAVTVATSSPLIARLLEATSGSYIRVQMS